MLYPLGRRGKPLLGRPVGVAHDADQGLPFFFGRDGDGNPAVIPRAGIGAVRGRGCIGRTIARTLIVAAIDRVIQHCGAGHANAGFYLRTVQVLALARPFFIVQGHQNGHGTIIRATPIHIRKAPAGRRMGGGQTGLFGQATHGLGNRPVGSVFHVGTFIAPTGLLHINNIRLNGFEGVITEPPFLHGLGRKGLNDHITDRNQLFEQLAALGRFHIQTDAIFTGIDIIEVATAIDALNLAGIQAGQVHGSGLFHGLFLTSGKRRHIAQKIQPIAPFNANDFRPQAGQ